MIVRAKIKKAIPLTIQWLLMLWLIYVIIFTLFRIATVVLFIPANVSLASLLPSFWLGFRFDAKWISMILLPIAILSIYPKFSPFYSERNKKLWSYYLALATLFVLFFFGADFGNFSYNHTRINASALNFAEDPAISFKMLWQSYPMVWIVTALVVSVILMSKLFKRTHVLTVKRNLQENMIYKKRWHVGAIIFLSWCLYGVFSFHPLKWKDAFELNDNFKSYVALNPLQNFFTTLQFRKPSFDDAKAKEYFPLVADFLQLDSKNIADKDYSREILPNSKALESRPNIVLVVCESFSMYKSSMSGNPLNTTPYFKKMCDSGIFFNRCFSPTFGTARGVFGVLTGIPDVQLSKFSTRNPAAINQHTIVNDFEDYNKYYFIGGSSDFNNFEGLVKNIKGVKLYQEGSFKSAPLNVWGISDKNLFVEANNVFSQQKKPFFAIIQTADNHRPFSIPDEDGDFERRIVNEDTLHKYGFESLKEFQSFCYTDYCFKKLIEGAKKQSWFNNTIFVFVGDHGVEGETSAIYPDNLNLGRLSDEHVPLLFYSPELLTPETRHEVASQIDVLPTIAGMVHQSYTNTTLGRDLLNSKNKMDAAFIIHHDEGNIGVVTNDYFFVKNLRISKEELLPINSNNFSINAAQQDSVKNKLSQLTSALYETAKWMLVNNKEK
ncbi:MAG: sulfatase-like hydrolase/transferase [Bacteroidota bacterium]|nr:sulfatase-like hydrolase/transferase [Bacteroidota bacterium]